MTTGAPMSLSTTSNQRLSRRFFVSLAYFIIYIHHDTSLIRRTVSFTLNTPSFTRISVPQGKQQHQQQLIPLPLSHNVRIVGHLNAIAIPPTSTTETYVNGFSSLVEQQQSQQQHQQQQPNVGVLLLNLGGPETGDDVEGTTCKLDAITGGVETSLPLILTYCCLLHASV